MHFEWSDLLTVLVLVALEGILSGDNALVLAVLVLPLPEEQQRKALRYGILGAYVLRSIATVLAVHLSQMTWVALVGGLYLLYLPFKHFTQHPDEAHDGDGKAAARGFLGLSLFWATVLKVEATDLVFAVDSILVAVAMTRKEWVIIAGGVLGITMMRLLTLQVLELVRRYPKLIDGAYIVVAWVGFKLLMEWLHKMHWIPFEIPRALGVGVVIVLFTAAFLYARAHPSPDSALSQTAEGAETLFSIENATSMDPLAPTPPVEPPGPPAAAEEPVARPGA